MEISHNARETGAAHFQRFEQARGVGVEYLESHAVNGSELFVYHAGVAAGVFEKSESAGLSELFEHLGSHNALIGIWTLIDAEVDIADGLDSPVYPLVYKGLCLFYLSVEVIRDMTGRDN